MDKQGISESKAKSILEETEATRTNYQDYYSGENWGYSGHYDLCLDEAKLGVDGGVEMVSAYMKVIGRN